MGQPIEIVAQTVMDSWYQNYRAASDFFTLADFVYHTGATIAGAYQQEYQRQYAENKLEKKEELVSFDPSWLNEQVLKVENKNGELIATLTEPIMSFLYDRCTAGIQFVFATKPRPEFELERLSLEEMWQAAYIPFSNRVYFVPQRDKITIVKKGNCNVAELRVLFIPAISNTMFIPDGLIDYAITNTVQRMKAFKEGIVVKKSLDGQQNIAFQTEMNPYANK